MQKSPKDPKYRIGYFKGPVAYRSELLERVWTRGAVRAYRAMLAVLAPHESEDREEAQKGPTFNHLALERSRAFSRYHKGLDGNWTRLQ